MSSEGHAYGSVWDAENGRTVLTCTLHNVAVEDHVLIDRAILRQLWDTYDDACWHITPDNEAGFNAIRDKVAHALGESLT